MTDLRAFRTVVAAAAVLPAAAYAFTPSSLPLADFSTSDPATVRIQADKGAKGVRASATTNSLDSSRALLFSAELSGPDARQAAVTLPVPSPLPGADQIELDARGEGKTACLVVTLTETDGSRWSATLPVTSEWTHFRAPLYQFTWLAGPDARRRSRPRPGQIRSVELGAGNTFQGPNGFAADNVRLSDAFPSVLLRAASAGPVPVQHDSKLVVETVETTGGPVVPFSGQLWVEAEDRNELLVPQLVPVEEGRAEIPLFARDWGQFPLHVYEPHTGAELTTSVTVAGGDIRVRFGFEGINEQQVIFANQTLVPRLLLNGAGQFPLSAHVRITDHLGQTVAAHNMSVTELATGKGKLRVPSPGLFQVELTAVSEPVSVLPSVEDIPTTSLYFALATRGIEQYVNLPQGVTTTTVAGQVIPLADLPSTATVVGRDRFTLWALALSPLENSGLYASPFGISSGDLFHFPESEMASTGLRRLDWQRRLGSFWGANELPWKEIEPAAGQFTLGRVKKALDLHRAAQIKLVGILGSAAAWAREGAAPATAEARQEFRRYFRQLLDMTPKVTRAYEVWNEPDTDSWKPAPSVDAYRELVRAAWEEMHAVPTSSTVRLAAGATAGFDPLFLRRLLEDGYSNFFDILSIHANPAAPAGSPEENGLPQVIEAFRSLMREFKVLSKESWISEIGWPTSPAGVSELDQANYLVRAYTVALAGGINKVFWSRLQDGERLPWAGEPGAHTGLMDSTFRPKPSFSAYNLMDFMLAQLKFTGMEQHGKAVIYSFDVLEQSYKYGGGRMHVAWSLDRNATEQVDLPIVAGGPLTVLDYLGAEQQPELISKAQRLDRATGSDEPDAPRVVPSEAVPTLSGAPTYDVPDMDNDSPTTRTYRFKIGHEPIYIWDMGLPPGQRPRK